MRVAIMQPYFFPYLGYFQLINSVDKFVIYDDVQYIKGGWINKNRILLNGNYSNIGLPVKKDSIKKKIRERYFVEDAVKHKIKLLRQIENAYKNAPYFENIFTFISKTLFFEERNVAKFNTWVLVEICRLLKITTKFYISSEIDMQNVLSGEERVIKINNIIGSKVYVNPAGGTELYHQQSFFKTGVDLKFLSTESYNYMQFGNPFVPNLSVIDILMFNSFDAINEMLLRYRLE